MNSRNKGATFEREIARRFREHGFLNAKRGLQYQSGMEAADVEGVRGYHLELKRTETLNLQRAYEQSVHDSKTGEVPVVISKKNGKDILITMPFNWWLKREMYLNDILKYAKGLRLAENYTDTAQVNRVLDFVIEVLSTHGGEDDERLNEEIEEL